MDYFQILRAAAPELLLVLAALAVLGVDLLFLREESVEYRCWISAAFACFGCVAAMGWTLSVGEDVDLLRGMFKVDGLTRLVKVALLAATLFTVLLSAHARFTEHVGEYFALVLLATTGMLFMVSSEELLTIFISLELTSVSLYILTAFNKQNLKSAEAALKYFLFGGMSAAFTLYGLSLLYGLAGTTHLREMAATFRGQPLNPLLIAAMVMTLVGFGSAQQNQPT